jgi:hypothetical protein
MDPMQQIFREAASRGLVDAMRSHHPGPPGAAQFPGIAAPMRAKQAPLSGLTGVLGHAVQAIPKVGAAVRIINAGGVADGTLDYARRMGRVR